MRAQHENRHGGDRRQFDLTATSPIAVDRRWKKDQRSYVVNERALYEAETTIPQDYWETYFRIPTRD